MSNYYNPELFSSSRLSEHIVAETKEHLDILGRPELKKELDKALFGSDAPKKSINLSSEFHTDRGWTV